MKTKHLSLAAVSATFLGLAFLAPSSLDSQEPAGVKPSQTIVSSNETTLSEDDHAVLTTSFFASDVLVADEGGTPRPKRVVSLACIVAVQEKWEETLFHGMNSVDALGSEEIPIWIGYETSPDSGSHDYEIKVSPVVGKSWGQVRDVDDLHFAVTLKRKR